MECTVITSSKSAGIGSGLSYDSGNNVLEPGTPVTVPLRKQIVEGIVLQVMHAKAEKEYELKPVSSVLHHKPLLTEPQIRTMEWMSSYYYCSLRQLVRVWLPSPPWNSLLPIKQKFYRLCDNPTTARLGKKQSSVLDFLHSHEWVSEARIKQEFSGCAATLRNLQQKNLIEQIEKEESGESSEKCIPKAVHLTEDQKRVAEDIAANKKPSLLFGITGSGKTEIYASLINDVLRQGKQSILLVPEILLTEHCIGRFEELLGKEHIAVLHSRLSPSVRKREWKRIHNNEVSLVIGSRSALFAPLSRLGLVIIDEEHEWTYKNEQTPRYHARETAEILCHFAQAKLVLGTASPSLESWHRTKTGRYHLTRLEKRYNNNALPNVRVIDLGTTEFGSLYPFSSTLLDAIGQRLDKKEQSVLFLNRRGVATALLCMECRRRVVSPQSNMPFTVHRNEDGKPYLLDHTSGLQADTPAACPSCGSANLRQIGAGTQRIEDILRKRFPKARILRADSDTMTHPEHMKDLLEKMRSRNADILLGTQSVVKGLDLPEVTLAAVLLADVGLSLPHFRAGERIFQLLTQLTGRSGRAKAGEVIIQTFRPDAPEIRLAAEHNTEQFLESELKLRMLSSYPPVSEMVRFLFRGDDAKQNAMAFARQLKSDTSMISCAPTLFGAGKVWHVLFRGNDVHPSLRSIDTSRVILDRDPMDCI